MPRHPDAHWTCRRCGVELIRAWGRVATPGPPYVPGGWIYMDASNGEPACRHASTPMYPPPKDAPLHEPLVPDLTTIEATEEYLAR